MSLADITPEPESPVEALATAGALKQWNGIMGNVALGRGQSGGKGTSGLSQASIEELGPDGGWTKVGHVESRIGKDESGHWPSEELTRIFLQDRCAATVATLPQGRTLTIYGLGTWRFNETKGTRVVGLDRGLPTIRVKAISRVFWRGGPVSLIADDASGTEIARFRKMRVRPPRGETGFPIGMLPARWKEALCASPRLFQSFGPPEMFVSPAMLPLIAAVALRQFAVDSVRGMD